MRQSRHVLGMARAEGCSESECFIASFHSSHFTLQLYFTAPPTGVPKPTTKQHSSLHHTLPGLPKQPFSFPVGAASCVVQPSPTSAEPELQQDGRSFPLAMQQSVPFQMAQAETFCMLAPSPSHSAAEPLVCPKVLVHHPFPKGEPCAHAKEQYHPSPSTPDS
eukprot:1028258-Rhodomonas_salina.1